MLFSKNSVAVAVAAVASVVSAASSMDMSTTATASSSAATGSVLVHVIQAMTDATSGKPVFDPPQVMASVGDIVQFQFHPMNHSVVQASFADPCIPLQDSAAGNGTVGFFSGFMPVSASSTEMPTFSITVNSTNPIWFYCSQGKHCQAGMVGAINPTVVKNLTSFQERAATAAQNVTPGQAVVPVSGSASSSAAAPMYTGSMTTVAAGSTGTAAAPSGSATGVSASTGAAAGLASFTNSGVMVAFAALAASMMVLA